MKSGGEISTVEQHVPTWGGGADVGEILMAESGQEHKEGKEVEWEVSSMTVSVLVSRIDNLGICH
jgi:hypothetical protein